VRRWISVLDWLPHYRRADLPAETYSGTGIVRVEAALSFTNAEPLANRLQELERECPGLHTIVLDASGVNHLDATADHQLRKLAARYRDRAYGCCS